MSRFRTIQAQAVLFTPAVSYRGSRFLSYFMSKWNELFDGEPISLEPPANLPSELVGAFPRAILKSANSLVRFQVSTQRLDFFSGVDDESSVNLREHFLRATDLFLDYMECMPAETNRVASAVTRAKPDEDSARTISCHFCREEWLAGPINRPAEFEIHTMKKYRLADAFDVNSWFRCKSGKMVKEQEDRIEQKAILVEQDINTRDNGQVLTPDEVRQYFSLAWQELEGILDLYFARHAD